MSDARRSPLSIRWRLTIIFLMVSLIPLAVVTAWNAAQTRREMLSFTEWSLLARSQNTVEAIEGYLQERLLDAQRQAQEPVLAPFMTERPNPSRGERGLLRHAFEANQRTYGYLRVAIIRSERELVVMVGASIPPGGFESQQVIREVLAGRPAVSDPFFAGPDGPYILEVGAPVRDAAGAVRGGVLFALPFDPIQAIVRSDDARAGPGSVGQLVDGHMIRIAHGSDPALLGRPLIPLPAGIAEPLAKRQRFGRRTREALGAPTAHREFAERIGVLRQDPKGSPFFDLAFPATGQRNRAAVSLLRRRPWAYAITIPYDVFRGPARTQLKRSLAVMALAAGGAGLLAWGLGGVLARRLTRLTEVTDRFASGNFSARVPGGAPDELGRLAQSFNTMAEALHAHERTGRERIRQLEALLEVGRVVTGTLELDVVLSLVVEKSVEALDVQAAAILGLDAANGALRPIKARGLSADYLSDFSLAAGEGVSGAALRDGSPTGTEDIQNDPRLRHSEGRRALLAAEGVRAALAVPIPTPPGPYGVLVLYRREARPFDEDQVRFATLLADQAAVAIENARLHDQRSAQMLALSEALKKLVIAQPLEAFFRDLVEVARQAVRARYGALRIGGEDAHSTHFVPAGLTPEEVERIGPLPHGRGLLGHLLRVPHPLRLNDLRTHPEHSGFPPHHPMMRSFLGVRLSFQDRVIGAFYLAEKVEGSFTADDERLLESFAANAAVAITSAQAYHDMQEARRALEEKTKELEAFTYTVSHDLKAPLRGIEGFSRALEEDCGSRLDDTGRHYLAMVRSAARRMSDLIEDLLTYSRLERRALRLGPVDLPQLWTRILEDHRRGIEQKQVTVRLELAATQVTAEAEGLREALTNLLDNAVKFSRPGGHVTISSQALNGLPPGGGPAGTPAPIPTHAGAGTGPPHVVVAVEDEGIGFDMKYHDRIFEIFQRLHRAEDYEGTGVGLAIVKKVAERHGGRAWAESVPGKGSTFYLALPS